MNGEEKSGIKLVTVDDDAAALELVQQALKRLPVEVFTAQDPEVGLETCP